MTAWSVSCLTKNATNREQPRNEPTCLLKTEAIVRNFRFVSVLYVIPELVFKFERVFVLLLEIRVPLTG